MLEEQLRTPLRLPDHFTRDFPRRFGHLSMGTYVWLMQAVARVYRDNDIEPFVPEMVSVLEPGFLVRLDAWTAIRNEISHHTVNLDDQEVQIRCFDYQRTLADLLAAIAFLVRYPLVTIRDIHLDKRKRSPARYRHDVKILNNITSNFAGREHTFDAYCDSHAVLLVRSLARAPEEFLNLSPLVIDTHCEVLDSADKVRNVKKDIFLYSRRDPGRIRYVGTEVRDRCDLRSLSSYGALERELEEFFEAFSAGSPPAERVNA